MNNLKEASSQALTQLMALLKNIRGDQYNSSLHIFKGSSIGKHIRHVIEFYQCLFNASDTVINYDLRQRNSIIETDKNTAVNKIEEIMERIKLLNEDRTIELHTNYVVDNNGSSRFKTSLLRELAYNLEHTIHHMAILRIGLESLSPNYQFPENFGTAISTLRNQKDLIRL